MCTVNVFVRFPVRGCRCCQTVTGISLRAAKTKMIGVVMTRIVCSISAIGFPVAESRPTQQYVTSAPAARENAGGPQRRAHANTAASSAGMSDRAPRMEQCGLVHQVECRARTEPDGEPGPRPRVSRDRTGRRRQHHERDGHHGRDRRDDAADRVQRQDENRPLAIDAEHGDVCGAQQVEAQVVGAEQRLREQASSTTPKAGANVRIVGQPRPRRRASSRTSTAADP